MQQILNYQGLDVQEKFKKYFESFDLAKVFKEKMAKAGNLVLANYYETRLMTPFQDVLGSSPKSLPPWSHKEFKEFVDDKGTLSIAFEGYRAIEQDLASKVEYQMSSGVMANIANDKPNTPMGSQMHKRFERDGDRLQKKFLMYSKRSMA